MARPNTLNAAQVRNIVLGQIVAQLRARQGLDQNTFAHRAGMAQSSVSRLERGQSSLDWQTFGRVAETLSTTPEELNRLVDAGEARAQRIISATAKAAGGSKGKTGAEWWEAVLVLAGLIGFIALITYAVSMEVNEDGDNC